MSLVITKVSKFSQTNNSLKTKFSNRNNVIASTSDVVSTVLVLGTGLSSTAS
jgi:hypothetical protein